MDARTEFDADRYAAAFQRDGYSIHEGILSLGEVQSLRDAVAALPNRVEVRRRKSVYGVRNLLEICPPVATLATFWHQEYAAAQLPGRLEWNNPLGKTIAGTQNADEQTVAVARRKRVYSDGKSAHAAH